MGRKATVQTEAAWTAFKFHRSVAAAARAMDVGRMSLARALQRGGLPSNRLELEAWEAGGRATRGLT